MTTVKTTAEPSAQSVPSAHEPTLITEQQVVFATRAAAAAPRGHRRWVDALHHLVDGPDAAVDRHRPQYYPYLESSAMSREMEHL